VLASIITGISSLGDVRRIGGIGFRTVGFYFMTTCFSVGLGVLMVTLIKPGAGASEALLAAQEDETVAAIAQTRADVTFSDVILDFLSPNIMGAFAGGDMLPIIVFALFFGGVLTTMGERGKPVLAFFDGVNEAMMKLIGLILWLAPLGVAGLVIARFGAASLEPGGLSAMITSVGKFSAVVLTGLGLHALVTLPVLLWVLARMNPLKYFGAMMPALLTAWSTSSSGATIPVTIESAVDRGGIDTRAAGFVIPLGATVNMDGTAFYIAVTVVFIAQALSLDLSAAQLFLIFVTASISSIGVAAVPQASLVMIIVILQQVDLPVEGIGMILAVDWFLDRFRTVANVWGDSIGAAYVSRALN
jgi:Na+/H+-dicarboxylate symporter